MNKKNLPSEIRIPFGRFFIKTFRGGCKLCRIHKDVALSDVVLSANNIFRFSDKFAAVNKGDKWGVIDNNANIIIPIQYDGVLMGHVEGMFIVRQNRKFALIDRMNNVIIQDYDRIAFFYDVVWVVKNGLSGICAMDGAVLAPVKYRTILAWGEPMISFYTTEGVQGFMNEKYEEIYPEYRVGCFNQKGFAIKFDKDTGKIGIINKNFKEIVPCIYEYINAYEPEYAYVNKGGIPDKERPGLISGGLWGVIDYNGEFIVPLTCTSRAEAYQKLPGEKECVRWPKFGTHTTNKGVKFKYECLVFPNGWKSQTLCFYDRDDKLRNEYGQMMKSIYEQKKTNRTRKD